MPVHGNKWALFGSTMVAGAAITRARAVKRGADSNTAVPATAGSTAIGIAMDHQERVGAAFPFVHRPGEVVNVEAGAAFALDAKLAPDANGRLIAAGAGVAAIAVAREAATALGDLVAAELLGPGVTG